MEEELLAGMSERDIDMAFKFAEQEQEYQRKIEEARVFGIMESQVQIATSLLDLTDLSDKKIEEVTGLNLGHIKSIKGDNSN